MTRVKRGNVARKRRNKVLKLAKGFRGSHSKLFRTANQQVMKALRNAYRDRRKKKRDFRSLWITRINAAARQQGLTYSKFAGLLKKANIEINRKMLSQIAILDPQAFTAIVEKAKAMIWWVDAQKRKGGHTECVLPFFFVIKIYKTWWFR